MHFTYQKIILLIGGIALLIAGCHYLGGRTPDRYLVPAGYKGPLLFEYNIKDAPPMRIEDGHYLIVFDAKGKAATSQKEPHNDEQGWARDEFLYVSPDGTRIPVPETYAHDKGIGKEEGMQNGRLLYSRLYKQLFIGTEQQYNKFFYQNTN